MTDIARWFAEAPPWQREMAVLRAIAFGFGLGEALKWSNPCFMPMAPALPSCNRSRPSCV
jgi:hypothetical protein